MSSFDYSHILTKVVDELSDKRSYEGLFQQHKEGDPLPSSISLHRIIDLARAILFPGYFGNSTINKHTIPYHIGVNIESLYNLLIEQIQAGFYFGIENNGLKITEKPYKENAYSECWHRFCRLQHLRSKGR